MKCLLEMAEKREVEARYLHLVQRVVTCASLAVYDNTDQHMFRLEEAVNALSAFEKDHGLEEV